MFFKTFVNKNNNVDVNQVTQDLIEQTDDRIKIEKDNKQIEDLKDIRQILIESKTNGFD